MEAEKTGIFEHVHGFIKEHRAVVYCLCIFAITGLFFLSLYIEQDTPGEFFRKRGVDTIMNIMLALLFFFVGDILIERINRFKEKIADQARENDRQVLLNEFEKSQIKYKKGFIYTHVKEGMSKAIDYLEQCERNIYVIGTAKSEFLEGASDNAAIVKKYFAKTLEAIGREHVNYKRIANYKANTQLIAHLKDCLALNTNEKIKARVMIMDEFITANTFLIIDNKFLFISPTSLREEDKEISQYCHFTVDQNIIAAYTDHFKAIYKKALETVYEFSDQDEFVDAKGHKLGEVILMMKRTKEMANQMNEFVKTGYEWQLSYSKSILQDVNIRIRSMKENIFEVKHADVYSDLHLLTASFIEQLREGDEYETITYPLFWEGFSGNNLFKDANFKAIKRKAKISRYLVVNMENTSEDYSRGVREAIRTNLRWYRDCSGTYVFKILFVANDKEFNIDGDKPFSYAKINYHRGNPVKADCWIIDPDNENDAKVTCVCHKDAEDGERFRKAKGNAGITMDKFRRHLNTQKGKNSDQQNIILLALKDRFGVEEKIDWHLHCSQ